MKKQLALIITGLLLLCSNLCAQTFYVCEYTDQDNRQIKSLTLYYGDDGEKNEIRSFDLMRPGKVEVHTYVSVYNKGKKKRRSTELPMTVMVSEDDAPVYIFIWDPDSTTVRQRTPYIAKDENQPFEKYVRAEYYNEVNFISMNETFISEFYDKSDPMYQKLLNAHNQAVKEEAELLPRLGDGSNIYRTMGRSLYSMTHSNQNIEQEMTEFYWPNYYKWFNGQKEGNANVAEDVEPGGDDTPNTLDDKKSDSTAITLHLFLLANTEIGDIGSACGIDVKRIKSEMKGVASKLGMNFKEYDVLGEDLSKANLQARLAELKPSANDVVFFLYTGHGFRWDDQKDPYPQLALVKDDYTDVKAGNFVALSDVNDEIIKKGARLNIVLSDCCNSLYGENSPLPLGLNSLYSRGNNNLSAEHLRELFINQSGNILSTAASPGEYSWCSQVGGNYTNNFLEAFRNEINMLSTTEASWSHIIDTTIQNAKTFSDKNCTRAQNGMKNIAVKSIKK